MAAAKRNKESNQKKLLGKKYMFIGQNPRACTQCGKTTKKGMLVEYENESFCSESCVVEYAK